MPALNKKLLKKIKKYWEIFKHLHLNFLIRMHFKFKHYEWQTYHQ